MKATCVCHVCSHLTFSMESVHRLTGALVLWRTLLIVHCMASISILSFQHILTVVVDVSVLLPFAMSQDSQFFGVMYTLSRAC